MSAVAPALLQLAEVRSAATSRWPLWGDYSLADPAFLLLIPAALAILAWGRSRRGRAAARVSVVPATRPPASLRQQTAWIATGMQAVALVLVVVALARPLRGNVQQTTVSEGVDIALLIDRSSSMQFPDLAPGEDKTRLDVTKEVVGEFAERRMTDRDGNADNIALVPFALFPEILCPFTLDAGALLELLATVEMAEPGGPEDGTAIGIALAKAVAMLRETDARSKVVVLLTDGENNVQEIQPLEAAQLAAEEGIRIYSIYAARFVYAQDGFYGYRPTNREPDTRELERIAQLTGGRFYRARDREGLEEIYEQIEALERTEREERRFMETFDLYPYFLNPAIGLYVLAWILGSTWARRLP